MSALVAFLGVRGAVVAAILGSLLLGASVFGGFQYFRAEAASLVAQKARADRRDANAALSSCLEANDSQTALEDARARLAEESARVYHAALDNARRAAEEARADKAKAEASLADFRRRFDGRSLTCDAALAATDAACPELSEY